MRTSVRTAVALLLTALFALTGCTAKITAGTVVDKSYRAAYSTTYMSCMSYNADGICTMQVPQQRHHPESWSITIQGMNEKQEQDTARYRVSEATYERLEFGDYFQTE